MNWLSINQFAIYAVRRSFIEVESSEKNKSYLMFLQKYTNGDFVYYKKNELENWMSPGILIG